MLRRVRWVFLSVATVVGLYALAGLLLSSRYDAKVGAFRASEAYADLLRRREDIPAEENAAPRFEEAWALLKQVPAEHAQYTYAWGWSEDDAVDAPPAAGDDEELAEDYRRLAEERRDERRRALLSLEPFVAALAAALERPAVQFPDRWGDAEDALHLAREMLPVRARLMPERAPECADLLLRLSTRWRARDTEVLARLFLLREALAVVRDALSGDPSGARPHLAAWRAWLAAEDPLREFRLQYAAQLHSTAAVVEEVRRGEDPFARTRDSVRQVREIVGDARKRVPEVARSDTDALLDRVEGSFPKPVIFRWYARPVFYWSLIKGSDAWIAAVESARTDEGLRALLERPDLDRMTRIVGVRTLEQLALLRLALLTTAIAAGDAPPELEDPFTGLPIRIRTEGEETVVSAPPPERLRDRETDLGLFSWAVHR